MKFFSKMINPFAKASSSPPKSFLPFIFWTIDGAKKTIFFATLASFAVGIAEAFGAIIIGWVIDTAINDGPAFFIKKHLFKNWKAMILAIGHCMSIPVLG